MVHEKRPETIVSTRENLMKTAHIMVLFSLCVISIICSVSTAAAGNGTLIFSFQYKDPVTAVVTPVPTAYVYLHNATKPPPMEKYFSMADQILWGAFGNGNYRVTVPEGTWYIRINQRADPAKRSSMGSKGPPQIGDLTWMQTAPFTISAGQTVNLGTLYAYPFASAPITITGTVTNGSGVPLAGRYVRAQTVPCTSDGYDNDVNQCGPVKDLAMQPTDANGKYTLVLRDPGAYYLYTSPCISSDYSPYTGNRCTYTPAQGNPVTVKLRDTVTVNITVYR